MKKKILFLIALVLLGGCNNMDVNETSPTYDEYEESSSSIPAHLPQIKIAKTEYGFAENIIVEVYNSSGKDWVGFYNENAEPGFVQSITWKYVENNTSLQFNTLSLTKPGKYHIYLCQNDKYVILDKKDIYILDSDTTDYGIKNAEFRSERVNGISSSLVRFTPTSTKELTYSFYWAKDNQRLKNYTPIKTFTYKAENTYEEVNIFLNDGIYMPSEANGIEIFVKEGRSSSLFIKADDTIKLPLSKFKYSFQVFSDLHIEDYSTYPQHITHLKQALNDSQRYYPDSSAIFVVGDQTNHGTEDNYRVLNEVIDSVKTEKLPNIYFALGNHEYIYNSSDFAKQVNLFLENTKMSSIYYSIDINDTKFIVLGSDTHVGEGEILPQQINWLKEELSKTDKNKPTFLFLHQPLKDTVSGSLYSIDKDIQDWYGCKVGGDEIRKILKNYPNATLFSGHTHWTFDSLQPVLMGRGEDANFVNCASVGYLWNDNDVAEPGSEGIFVEVYEDYVLIRGREFVEKKWCAVAQFMFPIVK